MRKFDFIYHSDITPKHQIRESEIDFLANLQKEMNTQDHVRQADPRYWVIKDSRRVYGTDLNSPDGEIVICDGNTLWSGGFISEHVAEVAKLIKERGIFCEDCQDEEIIALLMDGELAMTSVIQYEEVPTYSGFFLTSKAAQEHLEQNQHHYGDDAHVYAMTAWRSSEEPLWKLLQTVDFAKLKEVLHGKD